ncbi:MAG TPA: glycosyltransferase family 2 protein [Burkholderiales bacterium]
MKGLEREPGIANALARGPELRTKPAPSRTRTRRVPRPCLSVVVPLFREGGQVTHTIAAIVDVLTSLGTTFELILVDDGSPDDTWQAITGAASTYPFIRAARLSRNFGKEASVCAGLEMSRGDAVVVMDGDLQHPPSLIPEMLRLWRSGEVDVVDAVKEERGKESVWSRIGASLFYRSFNALAGQDLRGASDYKLLDRRVVNAWLQMKERSVFFRGMSAWLGFRRKQVHFKVEERRSGQSKWSTLKLVQLALTAVTAFSTAPLHLVSAAGAVFAVFALVLGAQALYLKLTGAAVTGFTTVILLLLIIGCVLMFALGIIGEYLARIYDEVKARPRYVVAEWIEREP